MTAVEGWGVTLPEFAGVFDDDIELLRSLVGEGARLLAKLPAKPIRSELEQAAADSILATMRSARARFLKPNAETAYARLTENLSISHRLAELVAQATERFPGLLPSTSEMAKERSSALVDQEGWEIDQGLFIQSLLRSPTCGSHLIRAMLAPTKRATTLISEFGRLGRVDLGTVRIERRGIAAHLTLQNTAHLNAEDVPLVNDLEVAIDLALLDPDIRVGVLRGGEMSHAKYAGRRVFCAGMNLHALRGGNIPLIEFLITRELGLVNKLRKGLRFDEEMRQKPWLAVVDAFAIGGGMQLLFNFDHVIAADDAYFSLPAANEGIVPGAGNLRIGRYMGARLARRVVLFGHRISASDPDARLLCDEVVAPCAMDAAVTASIAALDNPAVLANRHMLNLAEETESQFREYMAEFAVLQARRAHSVDVKVRLAGRS